MTKSRASITDIYGSAKFAELRTTTLSFFVPKFNMCELLEMCKISSKGEPNKMVWTFLYKSIVLNRKQKSEAHFILTNPSDNRLREKTFQLETNRNFRH